MKKETKQISVAEIEEYLDLFVDSKFPVFFEGIHDDEFSGHYALHRQLAWLYDRTGPGVQVSVSRIHRASCPFGNMLYVMRTVNNPLRKGPTSRLDKCLVAVLILPTRDKISGGQRHDTESD